MEARIRQRRNPLAANSSTPQQYRVPAIRYWINTISRAHVRIGVEGGFTQADQGKNTRLKRLEEGDLIAFYSPRNEFRGGEPLQAFTAIGPIADAEPYQFEMTPEFHPWRRRVEFFASEAAPIRPLIEGPDFIPNKQQWGYPFRRGLFEVERADFARIAGAMHVELQASRSVSTRRWVTPG